MKEIVYKMILFKNFNCAMKCDQRNCNSWAKKTNLFLRSLGWYKNYLLIVREAAANAKNKNFKNGEYQLCFMVISRSADEFV